MQHLHYPLPTAAELIRRAHKETGIDLVDHEAREPLEILVASINKESQLHRDGAIAMEAYLLRILSNRLRMKRDIEAHPEILDEHLQPPVIICGPPRTGTTKLHKMLAHSGDFNWLTFWQSLYPSLMTGERSESPNPRIEATDAYADWFRAYSPSARSGHEFATHEPEEELFIIEQSLISPVPTAWSVVDDYLGWFLEQDMQFRMQHLQKTLQYLQWQGYGSSDKPWILKYPMYFGSELELLKIFPGAKLLATHRLPRESVPSTQRMFEILHAPYTNHWNDIYDAAFRYSILIGNHMAVRSQIPENTMLDLYYEQIVRSSDAWIAQIYEMANLELSPMSMARIKGWLAHNPQHKKGRHQYSAEQYGTNALELDNMFADYMQLLYQLFPNEIERLKAS
ncbi:MAG: sulfotransferase family protein [Gammaproteobacteria bacterium]